MNNDLAASLSYTIGFTVAQVSASLVAYLPRLLSGILVFIIGIAIARALRSLIVRTLESLKLSSSLEKTPLSTFLLNTEISTKIEQAIGTIVYWLFVLFVVYTTVTILGLESASIVLNRVVLYIPRVFSAIIILFFGTLLAGLAEGLVKGAIRSMDASSARIMGTLTSYLIMIIAVMASVSELGIAQAFITTLFTGLIAALSLAFGLAFGLGSKDVVSAAMSEWYRKMKKED